ncbi:MAG: TonB C-terminal domain-containing protein [Candidatus Endonucleobacter sp. (ex Gigantidas childressi)]|nr:TonB C-terminal domain-containing protein [Candidatus Endonucleobacter sp. (ex Gigantidas childressi)]
MKTIFDKFRLELCQGYSIPIAVSMIIHGSIFGFLVISWPHAPVKQIVPLHLKASLIEAKQLKPPEPKTTELDRITAAKILKDKENDAQQKKEQALVLEQKKEIALKKKQQEVKEKEKLKAKKKKQEQEQEQEKEKQQADQRQKDLKELMKKLAEDRAQQKEQAEKEQLDKDGLEVAYYSNLLITRMSLHWNRPASALNHMVTVLEIVLSPFGELQGFKIITRSGNDAFDRSVIQAIKLGTPITELKDLDQRIFEKYFRRFTFKFSPGDLIK